MITIENKLVYTTLDELVDARHTALVVVDMQNDFCKSGWAFDRPGYRPLDVSARCSRVSRACSQGARDAGVVGDLHSDDHAARSQ